MLRTRFFCIEAEIYAHRCIGDRCYGNIHRVAKHHDADIFLRAEGEVRGNTWKTAAMLDDRAILHLLALESIAVVHTRLHELTRLHHLLDRVAVDDTRSVCGCTLIQVHRRILQHIPERRLHASTAMQNEGIILIITVRSPAILLQRVQGRCILIEGIADEADVTARHTERLQDLLIEVLCEGAVASVTTHDIGQ